MPELLTPEQQENCKAALAILEAAPAERIELSKYYQTADAPNCGTLFCAMGELCEAPYFKKLGWFWNEGVPSWSDAGGWPTGGVRTALKFFGRDSHGVLFRARDGSFIDTYLEWTNPQRYRALTDKDLAVLRMRLWLECNGNLNNLNLKDF